MHSGTNTKRTNTDIHTAYLRILCSLRGDLQRTDQQQPRRHCRGSRWSAADAGRAFGPAPAGRTGASARYSRVDPVLRVTMSIESQLHDYTRQTVEFVRTYEARAAPVSP